MLRKNFNIVLDNQIDKNISNKILGIINTNYPSKPRIFFKRKRKLIIKVHKDFDSEFFLLSNNLAKKNLKSNGFPIHNGIIILPEDGRFKTFIILFRNEIFSDYEYFSTVNHELTHICDYFQFFNERGNIYVGNAIYDDFFFWTEFHAKKVGLQHLKFELEKENKEISLIKARESFEIELNHNFSWNKKLYLLTHFLARISIYDIEKELNFSQEEFPKIFLLGLFGESIIEYYKILSEMATYNIYKKNSRELIKVLEIMQGQFKI